MKIILVLLLFFNFVYAEDYDVIKKPTGSVKSMSRSEVRAMFSMYIKRWDDGTPITVILLPYENWQHKQFVRNILRGTPKRFRERIEEVRNGKGGVSLKQVRDFDDMIPLVAETIGSIGYTASYLVGDFGAGYVEIVNIH